MLVNPILCRALLIFHTNVIAGKCDLFTGEWIPDPSGPFYTNQSCFQIEGHQNCMKNGRTDSGYLYWRWNPRGCDLPKFNPGKFLRLMRNKSWAFVGDSISRNHVQSLLCILSQVKNQEFKENLCALICNYGLIDSMENCNHQ